MAKTISIDELQKDLKRIAKELANPRPLLLDIEGAARSEAKESFIEAKDPVSGKKWQELSPMTKANKKRKNLSEKKLIATSKLKNSINGRILNDTVSIGVNLPYAAIHEYGGKAGRNHKVKIPARPYMPMNKDGALSKSLDKSIDRYIDEWIERILK